jgi:2-C-methyl-D-erythritol 2,4-cyclodiphosphate synthase
MNMRIGEGWDVHALVPGRQLILGGVQIAHPTGLMGHSDADVLLHAITDAVLEKLGPVGMGQSMEARAVVLLVLKSASPA